MTGAADRPAGVADPLAGFSAMQSATLALLRDEMFALGRMLPSHPAPADPLREANHAARIEDAFDDVPV